MPLSCRFHRAWKDFWYFIQKARMCTAVSRAIYRQGRAEGNLGERSEVPRAGPRLRPHLTLLTDCFDEATFRSDFSGSGSSSVDSWRLGATWQSAAPDLLAHAHALRVMRDLWGKYSSFSPLGPYFLSFPSIPCYCRPC